MRRIQDEESDGEGERAESMDREAIAADLFSDDVSLKNILYSFTTDILGKYLLI